MDFGWLEIGDIVEIRSSGGYVERGTIIQLNESSIVIRKANGLKSFFNIEKIEAISQVDSVSVETEPPEQKKSVPAVEPAVIRPEFQASANTFLHDYAQFMVKVNACSASPEITLESVKKYVPASTEAKKDYYRICQSVDYAVNKDKSNIDERIYAGILNLQDLYQEFRDAQMLKAAAFFMTLYTGNKPMKINRFCDGVNMLLEYHEQQAAIDYYLSNGTLPYSLGLWKFFYTKPEYLVFTFSKSFINNFAFHSYLLEYLDEIYASPMHDISVKTIIFYALLKQLSPSDASSMNTEGDETALMNRLYTSLKEIAKTYMDQGTVLPGSDQYVIVTNDMHEIPFLNREKFSAGDIVRFSYDFERKETVVHAVVSKETPKGENLSRLYNIACTYPARDNTIVAIKQKIHRVRMAPVPTVQPVNTPPAKQPVQIKVSDYSDLMKMIQSAKTPQEITRTAKKLEEYLQRNPKHKTAVKDLIALYLRKSAPHYEDAIRVFEKYEALFEDDITEKNKLYRLIYDAFFGAGCYEEAAEKLLFVIENSEDVPADYYAKLAQCYLQMPDYAEALKWCGMADKAPGGQAANLKPLVLVCRFAAYVGMKNQEDAEKTLNQYAELTGRTDRIEELRKILNALKEGNEIDEDSFDSIILVYSDSDHVLLSELYTPYLKSKLEECQFSQIRDRRYNETTMRYTWDPRDHSNAMDIMHSIQSTSVYFEKNSSPLRIRFGVLDEVSDKYLNMIKIVEICLQKTEEWELSLEDQNKLKSYFLMFSARYMWFQYYIYSVKDNASPDTCAFLLKECIILSLKDYTNAANKCDFYDALNRYISYVAEFKQVAQLPLFKDTRRNEPVKAREVLTGNIRKVFSNNPIGLLKALCSIISSYQDFDHLAEEFLISADITSGQVHEELLKVYEGDADFEALRGDDKVTLIHLLNMYADKLRRNYNDLSTAISESIIAVRSSDLPSVQTNARRIEALTEHLLKTRLMKEDVENCRDFSRILYQPEGECFISLAGETSYELCNQIYTAMKNESIQKKDRFSLHPTDLSFIFPAAYQMLEEVSAKKRETIIEETMPVISVSDDYENTGYVPLESSIKLMLRIWNGRQGENCTTATKIGVHIRLPENEKKCEFTRVHYENVIASLRQGQDALVTLEVGLTAEGCQPNSMINLTLIISYQTIKGPAEKEQRLVVFIKGDDFEEIPNPYNFTELSPDSANSNMFMGREDDLNSLSNEIINGGSGKTIIIYGQFRSGKSSLGNFLAARVLKEAPNFIFVNTKSVLSTDRICDIVNRIVSCTIEAFEDTFGAVPKLLENFEREKADDTNLVYYFQSFSKKLKKVLNSDYPGRRVLIMMDEFGRLLNNSDYTVFVELWKSVIGEGAFDAILIGHDSITRVIEKNQNAFGVVKLFHISYLTYEPTKKLITEPTSMELNGEKISRFIGGAIDYIWRETGGNVFYTQHICSYAVDLMIKRHIPVVNEVYVEEAIKEHINAMSPEDIINLGHPLFQASEGPGGVTDYQNKILLDAIVKTSNAGNATLSEIMQYLSSRGKENDFPLSTVQMVLNSLLKRKVTTFDEKSQTYDIIVKFYNDFLNNTIIQDAETHAF